MLYYYYIIMITLNNISSISDLRFKTKKVINKAAISPVFLFNRSTPTSVIISFEKYQEMTDVLDAGMQVTIASSQGFKISTYKGLHIYVPSGTWYHQMHITDLRRDPELMFYRMNQWGESHAKPLNEETPGGAWYRASDLDDEITRKSVEVYGYNKFQGSPGKADFSLV